MLLGVCIIMLATPVGSMTAMLAQQYGDDYELSSQYIAATTLFSVITMPLVYSLFF
jgi:predicted permease